MVINAAYLLGSLIISNFRFTSLQATLVSIP